MSVFQLQQSKLDSIKKRHLQTDLCFTFIIGFCCTIFIAIGNDYLRADRSFSSVENCILVNFINTTLGTDVHAVVISFWLEQENSDAFGMYRKP